MHKNAKCGQRCWYAKSDPKFCKCSCGGMNHGQGLVGEEMAKIQQEYPPCTPVRVNFLWKDVYLRFTSSGKTVFKEGEIYLCVQELFSPIHIKRVSGAEDDKEQTRPNE